MTQRSSEDPSIPGSSKSQMSRSAIIRANDQSVKELLKDEEKIKEGGINFLSSVLLLQNKNSEMIDTPQELKNDLQNYNTITNLAVKNGYQNSFATTPKSLNGITKILKEKYPLNDFKFDVAQLGELLIKKSKIAPSHKVPFLFGLEDTMVTKRAKKPKNSQQQQPDEIKEERKVGMKKEFSLEKGLTERGRELFGFLKKNKEGISLARSVGLEDWNQTIQRAFELSHLVRDGKASIKVKEGEVMVNADDITNESDGRVQLAMHLRYKDFVALNKMIHEEKVDKPIDINVDDDFV